MSLRHKKLADVWRQLQGRQLSTTFREILGQYSIDSTLQDDDPDRIHLSIRTIIWIKIIFDLQRAYLTGTDNGIAQCASDVRSWLLPYDLLISSILLLLNAKARLFPSHTEFVSQEYSSPRCILLQTLLSGLRLIVLRRERLAANDIRRIHESINSSWKNDLLQGAEHIIVRELFAALLESMDTLRENTYHAEWQAANLPTWTSGLYPLVIRPETFVTPLIHGTMEDDWADAFWVLYDCLWAVEFAVTQRYLDLPRRHIEGSDSTNTDETLQQLSQTRASLIISVFHITGPMTPAQSLLDSLAINLLDWSEDLDHFLSRQDSLLQQRSSPPQPSSSVSSYRKCVRDVNPYYDSAVKHLSIWLFHRQSDGEQLNARAHVVNGDNLRLYVSNWVSRICPSTSETQQRKLEGLNLPVYVVNCPKLHVIPKSLLQYKLRWSDKFAYESITEDSPMVQWKEGVNCPSCASGEKIKFARLIEPFQQLLNVTEPNNTDNFSIGSGSYDPGSTSVTSRSVSEAEISILSLPMQTSLGLHVPPEIYPNDKTAAKAVDLSVPPPDYLESPISPVSSQSHSHHSSYTDYPVSPLNESLNIPIPLAARFSMELPIPLNAPSITECAKEVIPVSNRPNTSNSQFDSPSTDSIRLGQAPLKIRSASRTMKFANSIRRKPATKDKETHLPKDLSFTFSTSGRSLLCWCKKGDHLVRFDIPNNNVSSTQCCKYEVAGSIKAAAIGNGKCAVIANAAQKDKLIVFRDLNPTMEHEVEIAISERSGEICLAISRNDKFLAVSVNDSIQIFVLEENIKAIPFHQQIHAFELKAGISHRRTIPVTRAKSEHTTKDRGKAEGGWFDEQSKALSAKEAAEEERRRTTVVSRKIHFSTDSKQLVEASQLGDHSVYIDVWDITREPVSTISEHSRSFKLPPWTLNDGDLTSVFYDSVRRNAFVTAFLGKEYPILIPFPGYGDLQNEMYSTKVIHAAQSPSGASLVVANAMTEIIQFEYTSKGTLGPRKLKKASGKISTSVFKPGAIALAMPQEDILQCFWIKDGKCMLRTIKIGLVETFEDFDLRPHYDRLMSLKDKSVIARAPSLLIPELDGGLS